MLRVARELRILSIIDLNNNRSFHLEAIIKMLRNRGLKAVTARVDYESQNVLTKC